jgi:hypothetical protein
MCAGGRICRAPESLTRTRGAASSPLCVCTYVRCAENTSSLTHNITTERVHSSCGCYRWRLAWGAPPLGDGRVGLRRAACVYSGSVLPTRPQHTTHQLVERQHRPAAVVPYQQRFQFDESRELTCRVGCDTPPYADRSRAALRPCPCRQSDETPSPRRTLRGGGGGGVWRKRVQLRPERQGFSRL